MNIADLIEREYGVKTTYNQDPLVSSVAITVTKLMGLNPRRLAMVVVNLGSNVVTIAPDNNVSTTRGIYLVPNGGSVSFNWRTDFELCAMDWYAISNGGASDIYTLEVLTQ